MRAYEATATIAAAPDVGWSMPDLGPSFDKLARGLKRRAERDG